MICTSDVCRERAAPLLGLVGGFWRAVPSASNQQPCLPEGDPRERRTFMARFGKWMVVFSLGDSIWVERMQAGRFDKGPHGDTAGKMRAVLHRAKLVFSTPGAACSSSSSLKFGGRGLVVASFDDHSRKGQERLFKKGTVPKRLILNKDMYPP
jgi:hypothetical protein